MQTESNTELGLWVKCTDVYNDVELIEQGGPLILYYVIHDIQDTSEQSLDSLVKHLRSFNIKTIPGEDVTKAITLIKSTHRVLVNASSPSHNFVPTDFPKTVISVFQIQLSIREVGIRNT